MSRTVKTLTPSECDLLIGSVTWTDPTMYLFKEKLRNKLMILLMLDAGLRVGELVKLKISDLFFGDHPVNTLILRAEITKSHKERCVPMSDRLVSTIWENTTHLWRAHERGSETYAFTQSWKGKPLSTRQVQRIVSSASLIALHRTIHPHVLRHTFATRLMQKTNIRVVQQLLGHSSLQSTQIYTHPNSIDLRNAIDAIQAEKKETLS